MQDLRSMDLSFPSRKKTALLVGENTVPIVDRISMLPDEVISYILSFLSTREAIRTSILSKRWEFLCTSTRELNIFDHVSYRPTGFYHCLESTFKEYVDRILFYHGGKTIQTCFFIIMNPKIAVNLYTWISLVLTCGVEVLKVEANLQVAQYLPWRIFTCRTLVSLTLYGLLVLNLPTYISLPSLKTLTLSCVVYPDDASMQRLLSSCPSLEDLLVERSGWDGVQIMTISVPSLKRFTYVSELHYSSGCKYMRVMDCPMLEYLSIYDVSLGDCSSNFPSSLVEACIRGHCTFGLFEGISHVKHLTLYGRALSSLKVAFDDDVNKLPTLYNLTKLVLIVGKHVDWDLLPVLLESSPNLKVLTFPKGLVVPRQNGCEFQSFYWFRPPSVAECLVSHLKTVEIKNFVGMAGEVYFVQHLLENSSVLERMDIHGYDFAGRPEKQKELESVRDEMFRMMNRASSYTCRLTFWM